MAALVDAWNPPGATHVYDEESNAVAVSLFG